jgi:hypothetical protein
MVLFCALLGGLVQEVDHGTSLELKVRRRKNWHAVLRPLKTATELGTASSMAALPLHRRMAT